MNIIDMEINKLKQPTILMDEVNLKDNIELLCQRVKENNEFKFIKVYLSSLCYEIKLNKNSDSFVIVEKKYSYNISRDSVENRHVLSLIRQL